jgi:hypothetical protein
MEIKDTFLIAFVVWLLALNKYERLKYLILTVFLMWLLLKFIKLRILKKKNLNQN